MIQNELRNLIQNRWIDLLRTRRTGISSSDYFTILEEKYELIDYPKMTGETFLTHLFMEETDPVMAMLASDILSERNGNDDVALLRNQMRVVESSQ